MLQFQRLSGDALKPYIADLARLRIEVFRAFPYLYDGDLEYEKNYLQTYIDAPGSVIVLAMDGDTVVGASTAIPLIQETDYVQAPFKANGYDLDKVFYCGESVLLPEYRGQGAGVKFFEEREAHAHKLGGFETSTFCAVDRPGNHSLRPENHVPLDEFWRHRGYEKHPELKTEFSWQEIGETTESPKSMTFWMKRL